jgi:hypothetical protein
MLLLKLGHTNKHDNISYRNTYHGSVCKPPAGHAQAAQLSPLDPAAAGPGVPTGTTLHRQARPSAAVLAAAVGRLWLQVWGLLGACQAKPGIPPSPALVQHQHRVSFSLGLLSQDIGLTILKSVFLCTAARISAQ